MQSDKADLRLIYEADPGTGPLMANCVEHQDDTASMAIYSDHVWCFGCERYWRADEFINQGYMNLVHNTRKTAYRRQEPVRQIPRSMVETYSRWLLEGSFKDRLEWLQARGLLLDTLEVNLIGHCGNAYTIPVFNDDGSVAAIRYRRDDKLTETGPPINDHIGPKYWGTRGANSATLYRPKPPKYNEFTEYSDCVLVEGELDALRLSQEHFRAVSLTNGAGAFKPEHLPLFEYEERVWVMYDQDETGRRAGARIASLMGIRAKHVKWPVVLGKDVTDLLSRYPVRALETFMTEREVVELA